MRVGGTGAAARRDGVPARGAGRPPRFRVKTQRRPGPAIVGRPL